MRCLLLLLALQIPLPAEGPLTVEELLLLRRVGVHDTELAVMLQRHGLKASPQVAVLAHEAGVAPALRDQLARFTPKRVELETLAAGYAEAAIGPFTTVAPSAWERSVFHQGSVECVVFTDSSSSARLILAVLPAVALPDDASLQIGRSLLLTQRGAFERGSFRVSHQPAVDLDGRFWSRIDLASSRPDAPRMEGVLFAGVFSGQPVFIAADCGALEKKVVLTHVTCAARALTAVSPGP